MTDSLRARTLINLSTVLYEQSAAQPSLPAEVSNMDLNFVPSVAFIPNVYIADSLRARTPINLSAVSNIDLDFVLSVAFIPNVHIADSLRARTLINLSAVLYEQAAAQTSLSAKVGNISLRARTLINLSAVLYEQADTRSSLPAKVSIIDLNFVPGVAFNAMGNVELTGDLLGDADRVNNNNNNIALTLQFSLTALLNLQSLASKRPASSSSDLNRRRTDPTIATLLAKRIKTDKDRKKSTHPGNNRNNLNIIVTDPTGREFSRVNMKSSTRLSSESPLGSLFLELISMTLQFKFYKGKNIQLLRSADVADVFDTVVSKLDEVPTQEPSTLYFMWDKEQDYSAEEHDYRKFYHLVITGEDTHCKQTIKKAYIMLLERASLILFMI
ncbi:hypothetical protein HBI18_155280 [Parastagonospora nodorum]|nr:hypothetical protein HBI18_155280 [Parastagonospora nodorum]